MKFRRLWVAVVVCCLCPWLIAAAQTTGDSPAKIRESLDREEDRKPPNEERGQRHRRWGRRLGKNHADVKAAFRDAADQVSPSTVRVLADGRPVALATVVNAQGYLLSKASLLDGELLCRLPDGRELAATIVGVQQDHDLALLKIDAAGLTPVCWREEDAPAGTFVAAVAPDGQVTGVGIIGSTPRSVADGSRFARRRAWLGIGLGRGESGMGVDSVSPKSAAQEAGLQVGDLVKSIDGQVMRSTRQIIATVGGHTPGDVITLLVERDEEQIELSATLRRWSNAPAPQDHWGGGPFSERRAGFPRVIPHDTIIRPSDCGGPLIDTDGKVVGVNIARALRVTTYAIPADTAQQVARDLRENDKKTTEDE